MHSFRWYRQVADPDTDTDAGPEPPGSRIMLAVYHVDRDGARVVKPPELHVGFTRIASLPDPPCQCPIACPLKSGH